MVSGEAAKAIQVIQPLTKTDAVPIVQTVSPPGSSPGSVQIVIVLCSTYAGRKLQVLRILNIQNEVS